MSTSTFREAVSVVAEKARAILPASVNGRIEGAVKLVLAHDVTRLDDGTIEVGSSTDALKVYHLIGSACDCKDFTDGKAPEGWCRHRIAAGIAKRVRELLPQVPVEPEMVEPWPDNDPEGPVEVPCAPKAPAPAPTPTPLPEAAFSLTLKGHVGGIDALLTIRGATAAEFTAHLASVRGLLDAVPVQAPAPENNAGTPQCPQHGALRQGKRGWYCPRKNDDGSWCPHKAK